MIDIQDVISTFTGDFAFTLVSASFFCAETGVLQVEHFILHVFGFDGSIFLVVKCRVEMV